MKTKNCRFGEIERAEKFRIKKTFRINIMVKHSVNMILNTLYSLSMSMHPHVLPIE